ncbi:MAG: sigma-70 family RNA polymerase sigma factor [Prevotella sp.]|nr:sigma-70 family RNA polymerase sigma factor [Prevotella sp.]
MKNVDLIFRNYYRQLCLYALHYLQDVELVEDVVQDCFLRLLEQPQEPRDVRAWLYAAVRNRSIDHLRRRCPVVGGLTAESTFLPSDTTGFITDEEAQERSVSEAALWVAVDALPARQREVFLLAKRDGLTYRAIAERMGISEKTVEHQLSSALKKLRGQKNDFFFFFFL